MRCLATHYQSSSALPQRAHHAHGHEAAGARIVLAWNIANFEAQLAEGALCDDLVPVAVDSGVGDHTHLGAIESNAGQAHRRGHVDAFGEAQRTFARAAAEELARLTELGSLGGA